VPVLLAEQRLVQVPVRPIARGHRIGDCDPGGDLDALDGVHDQKPQLAVEDVQVQDGVEGHPVAEGVGRQGGIIALERQGIAAQAVVTDEPQVVERLSPVGNLKAPLIRRSSCWSRVSAGLSNLVFLCFSGIKNPPWCADLTRGVAGVVTQYSRHPAGKIKANYRKIHLSQGSPDQKFIIKRAKHRHRQAAV